MKVARTDSRPSGRGRILVQLLYKPQSTTAEDYVTTRGWRDAKLEHCPDHKHGGCRLARHGTYCRKTPAGCRVARYYCPDAHRTFSLLPEFMAAGVPGTLQSIEDSVVAVEETDSLAAGADRARPGRHVDSRAARRWSVRRVNWVQLILMTLMTIRPDLYANIPISVTAFRQHTGSETVLVDLRLVASRHLQAMPNPVGFRRRLTGAGSQTGPPTHNGPCCGAGHSPNPPG